MAPSPNLLDPNTLTMPDASSCTLAFVFYNTDMFKSSVGYICSDGSKLSSVPKGKTSCGLYINGFVAPSPSNLSFPTINNTYKSTDLFIVPAVHKNIQQTGFDSSKITHELIVKHKGNTGATNLYLCFFLVNGQSETPAPYSSTTTIKDIDGLISYIASPSDGSSSIALNNYITVDKNSKAVLYINQNNEPVIVFTSPVVTLKTDLSKFLKNFDKDLKKSADFGFLLSNSSDSLTNVDLSNLKKNNWPSNGKLINGSGYYLVSNNIIYTMNGDQIYMECQPTGVSADEIKAYNVPIDSEYNNNSKKYDSMRDLVSVSIFFTVLLFYYFAGPYLYKMGVIDNVNKFVYATRNETDAITRLTTVDTFIFLYMIILIIVVAVKYQLSVIYLVVFFVLGIAIINYNKLFDDFTTTKVKNKDNSVKEYKMNLPKSATISYFDPRDMYAFIQESMEYLPNKDLYSGVLLFLVFITIVTLGAIKADPKYELRLTADELSLIYFGLIAVVPIFSMIRMHYVDADNTAVN